MSIAKPLLDQPEAGFEFATLAGGCFWCLEAVYADLRGVLDVESGYSGGELANPSYRAVCEGDTGHAEVVRIEFDPKLVSYRQILEVFFVIHDPTTPNRQGNDVGTQYRSAIFYHSEAQKNEAQSVLAEVASHHRSAVVTQLLPLAAYYRAEDSHQEYFAHNPDSGYCAVVVAPKIAKFQKTFAALRR